MVAIAGLDRRFHLRGGCPDPRGRPGGRPAWGRPGPAGSRRPAWPFVDRLTGQHRLQRVAQIGLLRARLHLAFPGHTGRRSRPGSGCGANPSSTRASQVRSTSSESLTLFWTSFRTGKSMPVSRTQLGDVRLRLVGIGVDAEKHDALAAIGVDSARSAGERRGCRPGSPSRGRPARSPSYPRSYTATRVDPRPRPRG